MVEGLNKQNSIMKELEKKANEADELEHQIGILGKEIIRLREIIGDLENDVEDLNQDSSKNEKKQHKETAKKAGNLASQLLSEKEFLIEQLKNLEKENEEVSFHLIFLKIQ